MRSGHAPGHVRDNFLDAIENYIRARTPDAEIVERLYELSGKLWNCNDVLPGDWANEIGAIRGYPGETPSTYARAARRLRSLLPRLHPQCNLART
jgi:hypothetical protein